MLYVVILKKKKKSTFKISRRRCLCFVTNSAESWIAATEMLEVLSGNTDSAFCIFRSSVSNEDPSSSQQSKWHQIISLFKHIYWWCQKKKKKEPGSSCYTKNDRWGVNGSVCVLRAIKKSSVYGFIRWLTFLHSPRSTYSSCDWILVLLWGSGNKLHSSSDPALTRLFTPSVSSSAVVKHTVYGVY